MPYAAVKRNSALAAGRCDKTPIDLPIHNFVDIEYAFPSLVDGPNAAPYAPGGRARLGLLRARPYGQYPACGGHCPCGTVPPAGTGDVLTRLAGRLHGCLP